MPPISSNYQTKVVMQHAAFFARIKEDNQTRTAAITQRINAFEREITHDTASPGPARLVPVQHNLPVHVIPEV